MRHGVATRWFGESRRTFATCPVTQATLLRLLMQQGASGGVPARALGPAHRPPGARVLARRRGLRRVDLGRLLAHRQVTDAHPVQPARAHAGRLATVDQGLARCIPTWASPSPRSGWP